MHGLVVIEGMTLSGHPWIINQMKPLSEVEPCLLVIQIQIQAV